MKGCPGRLRLGGLAGQVMGRTSWPPLPRWAGRTGLWPWTAPPRACRTRQGPSHPFMGALGSAWPRSPRRGCARLLDDVGLRSSALAVRPRTSRARLLFRSRAPDLTAFTALMLVWSSAREWRSPRIFLRSVVGLLDALGASFGAGACHALVFVPPPPVAPLTLKNAMFGAGVSHRARS